jgi:ATP-dependent exoDNAse (exonuclease V) alpha subunit
LVHFDQYTGPSFSHTAEGKPVIPILRSRREFSYSNAIYSTTQLPITIAYAITVHKAQGMTVHQAVLNISRKDFSLGLSYVAVSRVKTLDGILIEESFDFERFKPSDSLTKTQRAADVIRRRSEHV